MARFQGMKFEEFGRNLRARCGHLYVRIEQNDAYKTPGHPHYEPPSCNWFVEQDDEDKSYRRALAEGRARTVQDSISAIRKACKDLVDAVLASLREEDEPGRAGTG